MGSWWLKQHPQPGPEESLGNVFFFASALRGVSDRCGPPWALHALSEQGPLLFGDFPAMQTPVCERASAAFAILWQFPCHFQERAWRPAVELRIARSGACLGLASPICGTTAPSL